MQALPSVCPRAVWLPLFAAMLFTVTGCGSGGSSAVTTPVDQISPPAVSDCSDCGEVVIGLTDADGDFLSYLVDVQALSLTRAGGAVVNVLPSSARVDFAQYTELAEFFTAATVPSGVYVSGSITLDYAQAQVFVERDGEAVPATVTDAEGAPLGIQQMTIELSDRDQLVVRPGAPAVLMVDFDLNASHTVDLEQAEITAVAEPFLLAEINPSQVKTLRVRGPLVSVDTDQSTYNIAVRPFHLRNGNFGEATVHVSETTYMEIDGVAYKGTEGIQVLAALPPASATVALASFDVAGRRLDALEVFAGSSVPGGELDAAHGTVVAREGDTVFLRGARLIRSQAQLEFHEQMVIQLGAGTRVSKARFADFEGGIEAISVGQHIDVLGEVVDDLATRSGPTLDATEGFARLRVTTLSGVIASSDGGTVNLDLQSLSGQPVRRFDFAGTGSAGNDADPDNYEIDTGALPVDGIAVAAPVRAAGFVSPFGLAPPDFEATTLVDFSASRARLDIDWQAPGSPSPFLVVDSTGIVFDLESDDIGRRHHLRRGAVRVSLFDLQPVPVLVGASERTGVYAIRQRSSIQLFNDFAAFTAELTRRLDGSAAVRGLHALGGYDDGSGLFSAHRIAVRLD